MEQIENSRVHDADEEGGQEIEVDVSSFVELGNITVMGYSSPTQEAIGLGQRKNGYDFCSQICSFHVYSVTAVLLSQIKW